MKAKNIMFHCSFNMFAFNFSVCCFFPWYVYAFSQDKFLEGCLSSPIFCDSLIGYVYCMERRRQWHPTPVLLPGKSHGQRSLVGCSPWGRWGSETTERLHFHFLLSRIGEGNGNPLQYSCLENPRDRGAWWAAVHGVAQSWTWLKRLSSSNCMEEGRYVSVCLHCGWQDRFRLS